MLCTCLLLTALFAQQPDESLESIAQAWLDNVIKKDFASATKRFDETMLKAMPADKLLGLWDSLEKQLGPLKGRATGKVAPAGKYKAVLIPCEFEKMALTARIVFDDKKQIAGLQFLPTKDPAADYAYPDYVKKDSFTNKEVTVGNSPWQLPATLSLPNGDGPFPAVVLVHGSGPHDRDETIGPNKPFKDLAGGLASRGIAVLRYVKRTKQHAKELMDQKLNSLTLQEETVEDAVEAVKLLTRTEKIDPSKIFVLGHSLGGLCAPRIAKQEPRIAGFISLAGNSRPLEDLIIEQTEYIASLRTDRDDPTLPLLKKWGGQVRAMKKDGVKPDTASEKLPMGLPAAYWIDIREYKPTEVAKALPQPMLFLQGERDYQVTLADLDLWRSGLSGKANAKFKSYPKLNHLFMEGEGKAKPEEYGNPGHVHPEVIDDIARWILER